jgi:hypothetical protein
MLFLQGDPHKFSLYGVLKSLARPTSRCVCLMVRIFRLMLVFLCVCVYIYSTNIPQIVIINRIYENQHLLSL